MAKTAAEKLTIKPGDPVFFDGVDGERRKLIEPLPDDVSETSSPEGAAVVLLFARDRADLDAKAAAHLSAAAGARAIWIAYPKGNRADINRDSIWRRMEELGWTLTANVSLSDYWSVVRGKKAG